MADDSFDTAIKDLEELILKTRRSSTISKATLILILVTQIKNSFYAQLLPRTLPIQVHLAVTAIVAAACVIPASMLTAHFFARRYGYHEALLRRAKLIQERRAGLNVEAEHKL